MTGHIQSPCHRALFSLIQAYSETCERLHLQNLEYSEPWNVENPFIIASDAFSEPCHINENLRIFRTLIYLKPDTYSESSQRFGIEFFAKIVKRYNYFSKTLHVRSLTGFWIRLSLNKYSLDLALYLVWGIFRTLSFILNSDIFTFYYDIFRHFEAYLELCVTLAYSDPYHIQNLGIFRT